MLEIEMATLRSLGKSLGQIWGWAARRMMGGELRWWGVELWRGIAAVVALDPGLGLKVEYSRRRRV